MRLIDADEYEKRIKPYDTEDVIDKALYNFAHEKLITTPPAQPERKKGEWKHLGGDEWCCNQCGNVINTEGHWEHPLSNDRKMYHCNICGADMRGEEMSE